MCSFIFIDFPPLITKAAQKETQKKIKIPCKSTTKMNLVGVFVVYLSSLWSYEKMHAFTILGLY